jgi:hypothetical protein
VLDAGPTGLCPEPQLEQMLSARRAIKALNTLEALPRNKRVERCRELFDRVFRQQAHVVESALVHYGPPSGTVVLPLVHALCLAMFATAETGRRDVLAEEFLRLDELRRRVEGIIAENKTACLEVARQGGVDDFEFWKSYHLWACVPDLRFQLNVLRVAVSRDPNAPGSLLNQIDEYCRSMGMTATEVSIVPWNARTTCFEFRVGSPPDTSKGVTKHVFYDWGAKASMEGFRIDGLKGEIVRKVRELAL